MSITETSPRSFTQDELEKSRSAFSEAQAKYNAWVNQLVWIGSDETAAWGVGDVPVVAWDPSNQTFQTRESIDALAQWSPDYLLAPNYKGNVFQTLDLRKDYSHSMMDQWFGPWNIEAMSSNEGNALGKFAKWGTLGTMAVIAGAGLWATLGAGGAGAGAGAAGAGVTAAEEAAFTAGLGINAGEVGAGAGAAGAAGAGAMEAGGSGGNALAEGMNFGITNPENLSLAGMSGTGGGTTSAFTTGSVLTGGKMALTTTDLAIMGASGIASSVISNIMAGKATEAELQAAREAIAAQTGSAKYAADLVSQASKESNALIREMYYTSRSDLEPYRIAGTAALDTLVRKIQAGPGEFTTSPGYQFRLDEGIKALERGASAKGILDSGREKKALIRFGEDYATNEYQNFLSNYYQSLTPLATVAGSGQSAAAGSAGNATSTGNALATLTSGTGQNLANINLNLGQNTAQNLLSSGTARASGYINQSNALTAPINSFAQNYLLYNLIK